MTPAAALPDVINETVARFIADTAAQQILVVSKIPVPAIETASTLRVTRHSDAPSADALGTRIFDVAVIVDVQAALPRAEASALIARLRDVNARRVLVIGHDAASAGRTADEALRAYGFRRLLAHEAAGQHWTVHEFSIDSYKSTPDWLNAKYWAHPERFDKFRW